MAGTLKVCIDKRLPHEMAAGIPRHRVVEVPGMTPFRAIVPHPPKLWITGSTLRIYFMGGTDEQRQKALEQAGWWTQHANLKFEVVQTPDAEIRVAFDPTDGAWSYIGTDCRQIPRDQPTMNLGFMDGGTAAHEFGHAIGLGHEHQNPLSGIKWNKAVVIRDLGGPPNYWSPQQVRQNVFDTYDATIANGTVFDGASIMLYFFPSTWTTNGMGTRANEVLSETDIAFIKSAQVYPPGEFTANKLEVNGGPVSESIGMPAEEDLFTFTANSEGRHLIATSGRTDVAMKLFGPDSQTALIAEDDDSGVDTNARIVADLRPGRYYVQIRHYNRATGTGKYELSVMSA